jgi:hypothetical protein
VGIEEAANEAILFIREVEPQFDYDAESVEFVRLVIGGKRDEFSGNEELVQQFATMFGAHLGKAACLCNPAGKSRWFWREGTYCIELYRGANKLQVFPLIAVYAYIKSDESQSPTAFFDQVRNFLQTGQIGSSWN